MLKAFILFSSLIGVIIVLIIFAAIAFLIRDNKTINKFRKELVVGQRVTICKDNSVFKANIVSITPSYVRVLTLAGRSIGVNYEEIYPNNHFVDDSYSEYIGQKP